MVRLRSKARLVFLRLSHHYPLGHNEYTFIHTCRWQSLSPQPPKLGNEKARICNWTMPSRVSDWTLYQQVRPKPVLKSELLRTLEWCLSFLHSFHPVFFFLVRTFTFSPLSSSGHTFLAFVPSGREPVIPRIVRHYLLALSVQWAGILNLLWFSLVNWTPVTRFLGPPRKRFPEFAIFSTRLLLLQGRGTIHLLVCW